MCNNKYDKNERKVWEKRGKYAAGILSGKSLEEVAAEFETTVEFILSEIEEIKEENSLVYNQVKAKLAASC